MIAEIISFIAGAALASVIVGFCKAGNHGELVQLS